MMETRRPSPALTRATLAFVVSFAAPAAAQPLAEREEHTLEVSGTPLVRVMNFAGHVEVHGTDPGEDRVLRVVGVKRLSRELPPEESARILDRISLGLRHRAHHIEISPYGLRSGGGRRARNRDEGRGRGPDPFRPDTAEGPPLRDRPITEIRAPRQVPPVEVDLELWLPEGLSLEVHTFSAPVTLTDLRAPEGSFRLRSISGTLTLTGVEVHEVRAETVSAQLRIRDLRAQRGLFKTLTAAIHLDGALHAKGWYEFQTHSGPVVLGLGATAGFAIDAASFTGEVLNELEIEGETGRNRLAGGRGPSGPRLVVNTFSGAISLTEKIASNQLVAKDR